MAQSKVNGVIQKINYWIEHMPPAAFSAAMAPGIIGVGLALAGFNGLSMAFCIITTIVFVLLFIALALRLIRHRALLHQDALHPGKGFGFFTIAAAANVLALALGLLNLPTPSLIASVFGTLTWLLLTYSLPSGLVLHERPTPAIADANGSWFLWVVATQSVAGALVHHADRGVLVGIVAAGTWLLGCALYLLLVTLVTLRMIRYTNQAETLSPTYWIFMGATAISVLTGSQLLGLTNSGDLPMWLQPNIAFITVSLLAIGLWLIPMLVIFGFWRHVVRRHPLVYETGLWALVFPIGMLATACMSLGSYPGFGGLFLLGEFTIWCAVASWVGTAALWLAKVRPTA